MADTRSYTGVTEGVFDCAKAALQQNRFSIPAGTSGTIVAQPAGAIVTLEFLWDDVADTLDLEVTNKPSFIPVDQVWALTDAGITGCGGSVV